MMRLSEGRKSFQIGLVVLIQCRLWRTPSQPPSHPASHVAVAITLNAKASSLKMVSSLAENHPISTKFGVQTQILLPITAASQNIKILQIQYGGRPPYLKSFLGTSQRFVVRLTRNLVRRSKIMLDTSSFTKMTNFENSRCRTVAILKMVLSLYLSWESSVFNEIWYADADSRSKNGHVTKYQICKFKMAGGRLIENRLWLLLCDWCEIWYEEAWSCLTQVAWPKYQISKIPGGGRPPFWKWFYCYVLSAEHLISMKFDADANFNIKTRHVTKIKNFANIIYNARPMRNAE